LREWEIRNLRYEDIPEVVDLQPIVFPPPFSPDLLWKPSDLEKHLSVFPEGQFVATLGQKIIASCSNTRLVRYDKDLKWEDAITGFESDGTILFGLDISVHPDYRGLGIGRAFYNLRKRLVTGYYMTVCRVPDFHLSPQLTAQEYVNKVINSELTDRTLTPFLRYEMKVVDILRGHMIDPESRDTSVVLEWRP
jgi:GNAT superfamily N-acetyltransferase